MSSFLTLWQTRLILAATVSTTGVDTIMTSIQSFLEHFVLILGPVVFLVGLVAHGLGSTHNSSGMAQWGSRAMKAGAGIVIGALALTVVFATLQGIFGG
ncbi:MAG: hypothetical protein M0Z39_06520 [Actinomycetota bacterium]|jgi:hypothetical protein|nr:hypothetical protein [Actinomycetota bacterium]